MLDLFDREIPKTMNVRVTPKAKSQRIKKEFLENGDKLYRIYVTAAPEDGKANKAVIELIAKELGLAKSKISIVSGHTSRDKVIKIEV
jgi:uncharacterized protein (TIGR00251 family)